jgi:hypothetical protein
MEWQAKILSVVLFLTLLLSTGSGSYASDSIYRFSLDNGFRKQTCSVLQGNISVLMPIVSRSSGRRQKKHESSS